MKPRHRRFMWIGAGVLVLAEARLTGPDEDGEAAGAAE